MPFSLIKKIATGLLLCILIPAGNVSGQNSEYDSLFINEISPTNFQFADEFGDMDDWIELYNAGTSAINIEGLYITDDLNNPLRWQIGIPCEISPGGFAIIWLDGEPEQGGLHAPFKISSGGEQIGITQFKDGKVNWIDSLSFGSIPKYSALGRKADGSDTFYLFGDITPGHTNNEARLYLVPPLIRPSGKILDNALEVTISSPDTNVTIYYTLDGNEPDTTSLLYTGKILIDNSTQITAKAFKTGYIGFPSKETYINKIESELPVLSLEMKNKDLFDDETGIYVKGTNGITGHCLDYPANWNQDWEKPCTISMFEPDDSLAFKVNAGIKIGGGCSRGYNMKGFNVFLRKRYGDEFIPYRIFTNSEIDEYYRIKIRNAGSDFGSMMLRDGINQLLLYNKTDIDLMNYRPAVLYINGEFWGLYGIREFFNEHYIMSHYGYQEDEIDMIKSPFSVWSEIKAGDDISFNDLYNFVRDNDLSIEENYRIISELIDIDEYINYNVAEIYYANYDWPAINNSIWKPKNNGKWRWMLSDTDGSTNFDLWYDTYPSYNSLEHATIPFSDTWPNSEKSTVLLRKLLENENFKNEFIQRTYTFIETVFNPERVNRITDSMVNLINPVMDFHLDKWGVNIPQLGWGRTMEGSREEWEENIQDYKDFFAERPYYMIQHINEYFNPDGIFPEINMQKKFNIYPNPCNGIINIRTYNDWNYPVKVEIYNSQGQKVFDLSFDLQSYCNNKRIDISNLPDGMYFISINSKEGKYIEKLVLAK